MSLEEALNECVDREISTFIIDNQKIYPFDNHNMILKECGVEGYYVINNDDKTVIQFSIRDGANFNIHDYSIDFDRDGKIKRLYIDNAKYKIYFK